MPIAAAAGWPFVGRFHQGAVGGEVPDLVVGMVGRLAPWKGQDVFLRAFADAFRGAPEVRARVIGSVMFGEDDYEQQLRKLTVELGVKDRVTFVGFTEHVERELAELDILVHASVVPEPFGQVVVEGMAAGLAVIASAAGGPLEIITPELDGLLVPPGDVAALAAALRRLSDDGTLRERPGLAAILRALDFDPGPIGEQVQQLYRDLLPTRRWRSPHIGPNMDEHVVVGAESHLPSG